jgi:hypothetical protein
MGSKVAAIMERLRVCEFESTLRASRGPHTSRSWKPGYSITPKFLGNTEVYIKTMSVLMVGTIGVGLVH